MSKNKIKVLIELDEELFKNVVEQTKHGYIGSDVWIAVANGTPYNPSGDCISREALKEHKVYSKERHEYVVPVYNIDNAQAVEPFTQLEKEEIADAINYLLGAELLEENGYTEEVINALKSALKKVGGAE